MLYTYRVSAFITFTVLAWSSGMATICTKTYHFGTVFCVYQPVDPDKRGMIVCMFQ